MDDGWIKLHRRIKEHWIFENDHYFKAWCVMIMEANHRDKKVLIDGEIIECKRGQSVNSLNTWRKLFGPWWSRQKIRTFFKLLEDDAQINQQGLRKTTMITIINYNTYQSGQPTDNPQTNQQITNSQPTDNQQITTNKNVKNVKNERNNTYMRGQFEKFWSEYPHRQGIKIGKKDSLNKFISNVKPEQINDFFKALDNYKDSRDVREGYVKDPQRFISNSKWTWREWVNPEKAENKKRKVISL